MDAETTRHTPEDPIRSARDSVAPHLGLIDTRSAARRRCLCRGLCGADIERLEGQACRHHLWLVAGAASLASDCQNGNLPWSTGTMSIPTILWFSSKATLPNISPASQ